MAGVCLLFTRSPEACRCGGWGDRGDRYFSGVEKINQFMTLINVKPITYITWRRSRKNKAQQTPGKVNDAKPSPSSSLVSQRSNQDPPLLEGGWRGGHCPSRLFPSFFCPPYSPPTLDPKASQLPLEIKLMLKVQAVCPRRRTWRMCTSIQRDPQTRFWNVLSDGVNVCLPKRALRRGTRSLDLCLRESIFVMTVCAHLTESLAGIPKPV